MIFLSEDNVLIHKDCINTKRLQYSILEKSIDGIKGKTVGQILSMKLSRRDKYDVSELLADITLHDIFFHSFTDTAYIQPCEIGELCGSVSSLMSEIYKSSMRLNYGFVAVVASGKYVTVISGDKPVSFFEVGIPVLAIDVCEHAYFKDYLFDKERYILSALPYLDLGKISEFYREY